MSQNMTQPSSLLLARIESDVVSARSVILLR